MKRTLQKRTACILLALILLTAFAAAFAADPVAVTGVTLSEESLIIPVNGKAVLRATIEPAKATNKKLAWTSSNEAVATVNNGKISGVSVGTAVITVTAEDGNGPSASATVRVVVPVRKLTVAGEKNLEMPVDCTWKLTATAEPGNATIKDVIWSSSNTKVATVDENGVITTVGKGDAGITAAAADGGKAKVSVKVKVKDFDVVFREKTSQNVTYQYGSGFISVSGSVKTGCVRIPDVSTTILAVIGKDKETVNVSVSPVKPGSDIVKISVNGRIFAYTCFVCPELFPESGLAAAVQSQDSEAKDFLFLDIPWGSTTEEATVFVKAGSKTVKDTTKHSDHLRMQIKGDFKFLDYKATNCYLNFSFAEDEKDVEHNNAYYEADLYFDKDIALDALELAVRSVYSLSQGEQTNENEYVWKQGETLLKLTKKERFTILSFTKDE